MDRKTFNFRGIKLSYIDSGNKSLDPILIAHANGFSAGCYSFFIQKLSETYRVLALDFCGHGESEANMDWKDWFFFRDQILALIETENLKNVVGVGHSLGGASLILSSYKRPDLFRKIFAMDPVILNFAYLLLALAFDTPLAKGALKRRREFKDLALVKKAYRKTPTFVNWSDQVFEDYLNSCFRKEGEKWTLCCPPELEAKIFNSVSFLSLFQYGRIKTETHITLPRKYEVCSPSAAKRIIKGNSNSSLELWDDISHFFPFERPEKTLERIIQKL